MQTIGRVNGGALGRWFEQLCRIETRTLREIASDDGKRLRRHAVPHQGGVYAFWWTGELGPLKDKNNKKRIILHGPGGTPVRLLIDDEWLGIATGLPVPMYVGKTAHSIAKRLGQHLRLKDERTLRVSNDPRKQKAPTTSCQLRAGIEHFFPRMKKTRDLILDNIGLSFVSLDGPRHAANRFYLEDLAIGLMRPPLNVDVER